MTATDELRQMLDETGVEWHDDGYATTCTAWSSNGITWYGLWRDGSIELLAHHLTPAQAVAATICDNDATPTRQDVAANVDEIIEQAIAATVGRGTCRNVYLVEVCDDLLESWLPLAVYLHREAAEDCAEALRKEEDGVRQFARVSELKVVDE